MSRRTFFRYFQSKEDLIVEFLGDVGRWLVEGLAARPTREPHAVAVRHAFSGCTGTSQAQRSHTTACTCRSLLARG